MGHITPAANVFCVIVRTVCWSLNECWLRELFHKTDCQWQNGLIGSDSQQSLAADSATAFSLLQNTHYCISYTTHELSTHREVRDKANTIPLCSLSLPTMCHDFVWRKEPATDLNLLYISFERRPLLRHSARVRNVCIRTQRTTRTVESTDSDGWWETILFCLLQNNKTQVLASIFSLTVVCSRKKQRVGLWTPQVYILLGCSNKTVALPPVSFPLASYYMIHITSVLLLYRLFSQAEKEEIKQDKALLIPRGNFHIAAAAAAQRRAGNQTCRQHLKLSPSTQYASNMDVAAKKPLSVKHGRFTHI